MDKLFGTDGIRAVAGTFPLDYNSVYALGRGLVRLLQKEGLSPFILIGRDTRESGIWLEEALLQGIADEGGSAESAGVIPTSAISLLTKDESFSAGVVISASHNPYEHNGLKIFSGKGIKIPSTWEKYLEGYMQKFSGKGLPRNIFSPNSSRFTQNYLNFLKSRFSPAQPIKHMKIVCDCANGSSSNYSARLFSELGFEVISICNNPDGKNINHLCGSLHPQKLVQTVLENKADLGIAYDGDADRAIWVDETGKILNGDHTLYILSGYLKETKRLKSDFIVATVMSNLGLETALKEKDLKLLRTQVGDKFVLEAMLEIGANLGGERSGHTILLDECPTGDGLLTSLKILEAMLYYNSPLSQLVNSYLEYPQLLTNIKAQRRVDLQSIPEFRKVFQEITGKLGNNGRLHIRFSGTEPVVRIMIEGQDLNEITNYAELMKTTLEKYLDS
ncbi:MAG: phosphoglucosamine mutase [Acidobacteriota bacterium]